MDEVARVLRRRAQPPGAVPPLAMDPGMWLNIVNVKPPYLLDLEIDGMKNFILEYKRYAQKFQKFSTTAQIYAAIRSRRTSRNYL